MSRLHLLTSPTISNEVLGLLGDDQMDLGYDDIVDKLGIPSFNVKAAVAGVVKSGEFNAFRRLRILALEDALLIDANTALEQVMSITTDLFKHTSSLRGDSSIWHSRFYVSVHIFLHP